MRIQDYEQEGALWGKLYEELSPQQPVFSMPIRRISLYKDKEYMEHNPDIEIQVSIEGHYENTKHVEIKQIKQEEILCVTFQGSYEKIVQANQRALLWMDEHSRIFSGEFYCVYIVGKGECDNAEEWITQVCYQMKK